jgi:putative flippase GtrA
MTATPAQHWRIRLRTLARSWIVGGLATVPYLLGLYILIDLLGVNDRLANPPALIVGLTIQFFGNKYFAFEDHSPRLLHQGSLFLLVEVGAFLLNLIIYDRLVALMSMHYFPAMIIGTFVVYQGFSYPLWGYIFKKSVVEPDEAAAEAPGDLSPNDKPVESADRVAPPREAVSQIDPTAGAFEEA